MSDGKRIKRQFTKDVRAEVRPVAARVRQAYRSAPSTNQPNPPGRGDLRRLLARATTIQVKTSGRDAGVVLKVDGRKMPDRMGRVPAMYEGRVRWRHPVFNRRKWVAQPANPTFDRIVRAAAPRVRQRVVKLADEIARDVAKGRM